MLIGKLYIPITGSIPHFAIQELKEDISNILKKHHIKHGHVDFSSKSGDVYVKITASNDLSLQKAIKELINENDYTMEGIEFLGKK